MVDHLIDQLPLTILTVQVNGQLDVCGGLPPATPQRLTRAQQRVATRLTLIGAAAGCLMAEGYAGLTTRKVAERAGVAQSTVMHHFPTREAFLTETVTHLAVRLADDALQRIDLADLRQPALRDVVLDQAWTQFTSAEALAVLQLWIAAWTEPDLATALNELEARLGAIVIGTGATLFPDHADDERFPALIDTAISLIRGLVGHPDLRHRRCQRPLAGDQADPARGRLRPPRRAGPGKAPHPRDGVWAWLS